MTSEALHSYIQQEIENLRKSSGILNSLIESAAFGRAVITTDYHVIDLNRKMREWFPQTDASCFPLCYKTFRSEQDTVCPDCPATKTFDSVVFKLLTIFFAKTGCALPEKTIKLPFMRTPF